MDMIRRQLHWLKVIWKIKTHRVKENLLMKKEEKEQTPCRISEILLVNKKRGGKRSSRETRSKMEFLRASGDDNPPPPALERATRQGKNLENKGTG